MSGKKRGLLGWFKGDGETGSAPTEDAAQLTGRAPEDALTERLVDMGLIAKGGMCAVRKVYDNNLLRTVAMKVLDPSLAKNELEAQRFIEEAQITGQLDHPNIPAVHEVGVDEENTHYFTMKFVRGKTLDDILRSKSYSVMNEAELFKVLQIFIKVCQAIAFAHSRGVVHCDLKPLNVMVGSHGQVYVMDWGIARLMGGSRPSGADSQVRSVELRRDPGDHGDHGKIMGTVGFMAPEQAQGRNDDLDARSDVFQLGAVLYRILAGRPPYQGKTPNEALELAERCEWKPPQDVAMPGIVLPRRLCAIAMKAMAKDPKERYPTVEALQEDVEAFLRGAGRHPTRTFVRGTLIVEEGQKADAAYVIGKGRCQAFKVVDGKKHVLRTMGPGAVFGETAIFTDSPRTASVEALDEVTCAVVTRESLEQELGQSFLMGHFVKAMAERFRDVDGRATRAQQDFDTARLGAAVLRHLNFHGEAQDGRRVAKWSPLWRQLCQQFGWTEDEVLAVVRKVDGVKVDVAENTVALAPEAAQPPAPPPEALAEAVATPGSEAPVAKAGS